MQTNNLTIIKFNLKELKTIDFKIFENSHIVPLVCYEKLLTHFVFFPDDNNSIFITKYLKVCSLIVENQEGSIYSIDLQRIDHNYKKIINILDNAIGRHPYISPTHSNNQSKSKPFDYYFTANNLEWCLISIDYNNEGEIKTINNTLPINHPAHAQVNTILNVKLDLSNTIIDEYNNIFNSTYDWNDVKKEDITKFTSRIQRALSFQFNNKRFIKKGNDNEQGRVFSSLTSNLTKIARKHLYIDFKPFYEIDIANCQPLLMAVFLSSKGYIIDNNYITDVMDGIVYDRIVNYAITNNLQTQNCFQNGKTVNLKLTYRPDVKVLSYANIFFKTKTKEESTVSNIFSILYPLTYSALIDYTTKTTDSTALLLQATESEIIMNVSKTIDCEYFTVHDAIYITDYESIESLKKEIIKTVNEYSNGLINQVTFGKIEEKKPQLTIKHNFLKNQACVPIGAKKHKDSKKDEIVNYYRFVGNKKEVVARFNITPQYLNRIIKEVA